MEEIHCPICNQNNFSKPGVQYPGYIEGYVYDIYSCENCNTGFAHPMKVDPKIYDIIYSNQDQPGYDKYYQQALRIQSESDPLKYLSKTNPQYFPIYKYMAGRSNLKILEIGCGYGYLSYALKKLGNDVLGIDVSKNAIQFANEKFGDYFVVADALELVKENKSFDLIIATELIEHLSDPFGFTKTMISLLAKEGRIIITTPNKDFYSPDSIWKGDLPPVHLTFLSYRSFDTMANRLALKCENADYSAYYPSNENQLLVHFIKNKDVKPAPYLSKDGSNLAIHKISFSGSLKKVIRFSVVNIAPTRYLCNLVYNKFLTKQGYTTLAILFSKRKE